MFEAITKEEIAAIECRHVVYCKPPQGTSDDLHLVKEVIHTKDGRVIPNVRLIKNFKRPYWVTRPAYRNHQDKKEVEYLNRVEERQATQHELIDSAAKALGKFGFQGPLRKLARSPYLYGADILSTAVLKRRYMDTYSDPKYITPYGVASFDTETDVLHGTDEIVMATVSSKEKIYTCVKESFVAGHSNVINRLQELLTKYLGDVVEKRKIVWEVEIGPTEADIIVNCFKKLHEWKPDFMAIWNLDFDIGKILKGLEKAKIDPADVFSDPRVPYHYRHFEYKQGPSQKVTASGKVTPIKPAARWHTVIAPSSFYVIDAMCAYRHIRTGQQEEPSYSLDAILNKVLGMRKLKFEEANHLSGLAWHQFMQRHHPLEYVIYNVFDCVSMEMLDEVTKDLCLSLPMMSGCSDFMNFKSQPRRLVDELHYFVQKHGRVIGTTSDEMSGEFDELTIGLKDWI